MVKDKNDESRIIDGLTLFDDDLMTLVFDKNIPATELVLRIILGREIHVISVEAQEEMRNPIVGGRNIKLDIHAIDEDGEEIDIEVQGNSDGAHVRRARFHSAVIDSRMLKEKEHFKALKDSYVIFIYKRDKFGKGLPVYSADRVISQTGEPLGDGSHIIYVNGKYRGNDEIGKLMSDFRAKSSEKMHFKELSEGIHHFKETEEGRSIMCDTWTKLAKEYAEDKVVENKVEIAKKLVQNNGFSLEEALDAVGVGESERESVLNQLQEETVK